MHCLALGVTAETIGVDDENRSSRLLLDIFTEVCDPSFHSIKKKVYMSVQTLKIGQANRIHDDYFQFASFL